MHATLWQVIALPYGSFTGQKVTASILLYGIQTHNLRKQRTGHLLFVQLDAIIAVDSSTADCHG